MVKYLDPNTRPLFRSWLDYLSSKSAIITCSDNRVSVICVPTVQTLKEYKVEETVDVQMLDVILICIKGKLTDSMVLNTSIEY